MTETDRMNQAEITRRELTAYNEALRAELANAPAWKWNPVWALACEREIEVNEQWLRLLEGK